MRQSKPEKRTVEGYIFQLKFLLRLFDQVSKAFYKCWFFDLFFPVKLYSAFQRKSKTMLFIKRDNRRNFKGFSIDGLEYFQIIFNCGFDF